MGAEGIVTLTESCFEAEVLQSSVPVLVDYGAEWCGPCKMMVPILDELAAEYAGKVKFGKVNIDDCPNLASAHKVRAVPTLLLFKNGHVIDQIVGMCSKRKLIDTLAQATAANT